MTAVVRYVLLSKDQALPVYLRKPVANVTVLPCIAVTVIPGVIEVVPDAEPEISPEGVQVIL